MKKLFAVIFYLNTCLLWAQTSTVNLTSEKQYIRGFGGINHPEWAGDLTAAQRNTAFGNGSGEMGLTVLRIFINDDRTQWNKALATALRAQQLGATIFATPWNPPASMCETVTRNNRQEKRLKYDSYSAYAQHLIDFNNYMKSNGVNLYAMSFANEPDWGFDWTWYSIDEVYNFTKNIAGTLRVNGIKVITAESFSYNKSYYDKILNDPTALANIDIIGCHLYGSDANSPVSVYNYPLADSKAPTKERWMTEHYTNSDANSSDLWPDANDVSYEIYRCMVEGQMSVYTWWYIRRQYGPMNENGTISKRGYCMAQYSKFIRPGYKRVDATKNPTSGVYISAYKNGDDVVVVAVNRSTSSQTITISVPGTKVTTWEKYVTSGSKSLAKEANINSSTGSFQITLDPQSTTSFVGTALLGNPTVTITSPVSNTKFNVPATITFSAAASDPNGTVSTVQFYNGTTLLGSASTSPYSYTWTNVTPGAYTITAVATDNAGNKTTSAPVIITVAPPATITATGTTTFCSGGSVILNANSGAGYSYVWKNGTTTIAGATTSSYTATTSGSYTVAVSSNSQTTTSAATIVTVNALPTAAITTTTPTTFCAGGSVVLTASAGSSYVWKNGTTQLGTAQTYTATTAGSYTVEVTNANNCKAISAATIVTVNALPTASITTTTPTTFCAGGNVTLNANTGTGLSYQWYNGSNTIGTGNASLSLYVSSGSFTVKVTDVNGCTSTSAPVVVTINPLPAAPTVSTPVTYCQNAAATHLTATGTGLKWYADNITTTALTSAPTPVTTAPGTTNYYVSQTINGCESSRAQIAVTVNALPAAAITTTTATSFCTDGSVVLTASSGSSYVWKNGTATITGATAQAYTATTAGNYTVEVTNASGCKATSAATTVTVNALPAAAITTTTATTFCAGGSVVLTASSGSSYVWKNGTTQVGTSSTYTATTAGSYTVEVTNAGNCSATSAATTVTVNALPIATITANGPTIIQQGGSVVLTASSGSSYIWRNGTTQVGTNQTYTATAAGNYAVEVINSNSCSATSTAIAVTINSVNQPSVITITSPTANATITGAIDIAVNVTDPDGSIVTVEYLDGNTVIGTSPSAPYTYTWDNPSAGSHTITVRVTDSNGGITTSAPVTITSSSTTTGVQSSNTLNASIYPNPSSGIVFIDSDIDLSGASCMLVDVMGVEHIVPQTVNGMESQIDVSSLSDGAYVLIVKQGNAVMRKKITVIR